MTVVILMGTAVAVVAEGSCLEWKDAEELRRKAEHDLEDTWRELESTGTRRSPCRPRPEVLAGSGWMPDDKGEVPQARQPW